MRTLFFSLALLVAVNAIAQTPAPSAKPSRTKSLDFEENVVEGMNKNPLDFLEHVANKDNGGNVPLYKKRTNFKNEMRAASREMGFVP